MKVKASADPAFCPYCEKRLKADWVDALRKIPSSSFSGEPFEPWIGMSADKILFGGSGKTVKAIRNRNSRTKWNKATHKVWLGDYKGFPPFCSISCAAAFGRACYKRGVDLKSISVNPGFI